MEMSNSQASQDRFAYHICNTDNGYFLDIGSYEPLTANNTYLLESKGWKGLCFDITDYTQEYLINRSNKFIYGDVTKINMSEILKENNSPNIIDYISIDVDESTENFLNVFPFDEYEFRCITMEHDSYHIGDDFKIKSRQFFKDKGYTLVCSDVGVTYVTNNDPFEDWYINEKYVSKDRWERLVCNGYHHSDIIKLIKPIKECIILQYYLQDYHDINILNRCVDSISKSGIDIILVSHTPIPESIQKKVKYCLYDSDDELVTFEDVYHGKTKLYTNKRLHAEFGTVQPFLFVVDDISYSFCKCVYDSYRLATSFGYDYSYYIIGDFEIMESEIEEMKKVSLMVRNEGKMGYFEESDICINAFFWYVNNKWFLDNFFLNMNSKDEFLYDLKQLDLYCHYDFLVNYKIHNNRDKLIVKKVDYWGHPFVPDERSDLSKKKNSDGYNYDIGIFYGDNIPYLFCFDLDVNKRNWDVFIEYNNGEVSKYNIQVPGGNTWIIYQVEIKYDQFRIKVFNTNGHKLKYNIYIDDVNKYKETFKIK